jgi:hypothetical protein
MIDGATLGSTCRPISRAFPAPSGQRPGDRDPLPLEAGELVRKPVPQVGVDVDPAEQFDDCLRPPRLVDAGDVERFRDEVEHPHPWVDGGVRVLEDHLDRPRRPVPAAGWREQLGTAVDDLARAGRHEADERAGERRLAGPGLPDDIENLSFVDCRVDRIDRGDGAKASTGQTTPGVPHGQRVRREDGFAAGGCRWWVGRHGRRAGDGHGLVDPDETVHPGAEEVRRRLDQRPGVRVLRLAENPRRLAGLPRRGRRTSPPSGWRGCRRVSGRG